MGLKDIMRGVLTVGVFWVLVAIMIHAPLVSLWILAAVGISVALFLMAAYA